MRKLMGIAALILFLAPVGVETITKYEIYAESTSPFGELLLAGALLVLFLMRSGAMVLDLHDRLTAALMIAAIISIYLLPVSEDAPPDISALWVISNLLGLLIVLYDSIRDITRK